VVHLDDGQTLEADLLLTATGVKPDMGYLAGSSVAHDAGILVDDYMCTNVANVWAAGDCAQARDFFGDRPVMNAILPDAAEQGRIAGMAMAGDPGVKAYAGGVPLNTYNFFGRHAIAVGVGATPAGSEERVRHDEARGSYLRVVVKDGRLQGIFGVNEFFDGGVMRQLILRRVDISAALDRLVADPLTTGREFMSRLWK
jgi:phenylglyoxylate dehydrogenase epsilon subunit